MTTLPAVVRIVDLPIATTITGAEMLEVVQTGVGGTAISVQIPLTSIMTTTLGGLPIGGGTSQILAKSSGGNYSTNWYDLTNFISVISTTGLATSGSGTALVVAVATAGITRTQMSAAAIGSAQLDAAAVQQANVTANAIGNAQLRQGSPLSIIGVAGSATANVADITASSANQVLQVNAGGTGILFTTLTLGAGVIVRSNLTAFIIGSGQLDTSAILRANFTAFAVGSAQVDTSAILRANLTAFAVGSAQIDTSAIQRVNLTAFAIGSGQIDTSAILRANFTAFAIGSAQIDTSAILRANLTSFLIGSAQLDTGSINIASAIVTGILPVAMLATTSPPLGFNTPVNLGITASTAGSALTLNVVGINGSNPSATNPVLIPFRSPTTAVGTPNWIVATAALSITITQSATIGAVSGNPMRGWIVAHDTGTAPVLGVINCVVGMPSPSRIVQLAPQTLVTATAISSTSFTSGNFYASAAVNNRPFSIIGYFDYTNMTTAGQWTNTPDRIQLFGPGVKKPGDILQVVYITTSATSSTTGTTFVNSTLSATITPNDAQNVMEIIANGHGVVTSTAALYTALRVVGSATNLGVQNHNGFSFVGNLDMTVNHFAITSPATTAAVSYGIQFASAATGIQVGFPQSSLGTPYAAMSIKEMMG